MPESARSRHGTGCSGYVKESLEQRISDPSYKGNPKEILPSEIETSRLLLRRYRIEDAASLFHLIDKNRPDLWESFPLTYKEIAKREDADVYILNKLHQWFTKTFFCYAVIQKETSHNAVRLSQPPAAAALRGQI